MTEIARSAALTAAEKFWYVLGCIGFGAMYFAKVPIKKALSEVGLAQMTSAEQFWYVLQCIAFGAGYFAKVPVKKALSETTRVSGSGADTVSMAGYNRPQIQQAQESQGLYRQDDVSSPAPLPARRHARHDGGSHLS
jgi:hypothetical protein